MKNNREPDTLFIKKNASEEIIYHYNKEESSADRHKKPDVKGFKSLIRNKVLLIIVCDIILIILVFYILQGDIFKNDQKPEKKNIEGYDIALSGFRIKDKIYARLYIEKTPTAGNEEKNFIVRFYIDKNTSIRVSGELPVSAGESINTRATLISPDINSELFAQITIGQATDTLVITPLER